MKLGLRFFPTDYAIAPADAARAAEARGFESIFLAEHTHIPSSRLTPASRPGELGREYSHLLDPFVALGAMAAVTERLGLGIGVCLVPEHDPIITAKAVATIDHISGGRMLFGVGAGWNREEMENHGGDFARRWKIMRERVEAMKAIWSEEKATYHGEFVNFDAIWSWPKPVQKPHPPVLVGGYAPGTLKRVVRYGDGWLPHTAAGLDLDHFAARVRELEDMAAEAGRGALPVTLFGAPADPPQLERLRAMGVERCLVNLPPVPRDEALRELDRLAKLVGECA